MAAETELNTSRKSQYFVRGAFRRFFAPALFSSVWLAVAGVVDSIFVGNRIGSAGLASIGFGQPVYLFFNILSYGFSIGGSIHFASRLADGREEEANRIFLTVLRLLVCIYLLSAALGIIFLPQLMVFLGADPADEITRTYIRTQLTFVPIMFCQGPFFYFVNADGDPGLAAAAMSISGAVDTLFSYIFIVLMGLGVRGSVYSTVVGAVLMLSISGSHIFRKKGALRFRRSRFDRRAVVLSARTGFATASQYLFQFITLIAVNHLLMRTAGQVAVASFDVIYNLSLLCAAISDGVSIAIEPMLSSYRSERNLGNICTTLNLGLIWGGLFSSILAGVLALFPHEFSILFGMTDAEELLYASRGIRIFSLSVLPAMINAVFSTYYQSILREWLAFLITCLRSLVLYLLALYFCIRGGMDTFWFVFLMAEGCTLLIGFLISMFTGGIRQLKGIDISHVKTALIDSSAEDISSVIGQLQDFCEQQGAEVRQIMYVGLTIEEICVVIIDRFREQMGDIYIQVTVVAENGETTFFLRDNAFAFNPMAEDTECIDLEGSQGLDLMGLRIVQKKAKEFYYRRYTGFNTMVIRL